MCVFVGVCVCMCVFVHMRARFACLCSCMCADAIATFCVHREARQIYHSFFIYGWNIFNNYLYYEHTILTSDCAETIEQIYRMRACVHACLRACVQIKEQILKISGGVAFVKMRYVTHMNESYQISHVTHTNESCRTPKCVKSCTRTHHITHTNTSCHTHQYVMSHTRMHHVTHTNASCHTQERIMSHSWMRHVKRYVRRQNEKFSILCLLKILRVPGDAYAL